MSDTPRATYTGPAHPIGYVELQKSFVGPTDVNLVRALLEEAWEEMSRTEPRLVPHGSRLECSVDGAGVPHHTFYIGFAPNTPSSEPLDPHNMNDAPRPTAGMPEPTDGIMPLGSRETKF